MVKRPRASKSPTVIRCEKQPDGTTKCCTFKRGEEQGEPLRCFTSGLNRKKQRRSPPQE